MVVTAMVLWRSGPVLAGSGCWKLHHTFSSSLSGSDGGGAALLPRQNQVRDLAGRGSSRSSRARGPL